MRGIPVPMRVITSYSIHYTKLYDITREILDRLLSDISSGVRAEAGYQVGKVGGPEVLATLEKAIGQEVEVGVRRWIEAELRLLRVND